MKRDRSLTKEPLKPEASAGRNAGSLALADESIAVRVEEPPAASTGRNTGSLTPADKSVVARVEAAPAEESVAT